MAQTTRTTVPQLTYADKLEFGDNAKQESAYGTALGTADITDRVRPKGDLVVIKREINFQSDGEEIRGTEFPTDQYLLAHSLNFELASILTAENAALFAALGLGDVSSAVQQTDKYYLHTCIPQDRTVAQAAGNGGYSQLPSTSIRYTDGPGQNIADGICLVEFSIEGAFNDTYPEIKGTFWGSGNVSNDSNSFQSLPTEHRLKLAKVQIGVAASEEDISSAIESVTVGWNNNARDEDSRPPGSGLYRSQILLGERTPTLTLKFKQHSTDTELTNFLANTALKCIVTFEGDAITGTSPTAYYNMVWTFFECRYTGRDISASGQYRVNELELACFDDGSNGILQVEINNDETAYLAVAA